MQVQPYLFFNGRCEEAIEFYRGALGAEVTLLMRFKECPEPCDPDRMSADAGDLFSPHFGMVTDRFGVSWMIIVAA